MIEERYGRQIAEVHQDVGALALPGRLAVLLRTKAGSPALRVVRRCLNPAGEVFEISDTLHSTGRVRVVRYGIKQALEHVGFPQSRKRFLRPAVD